MTTLASLIRPERIRTDTLMPFNHRMVGGQVLISNEIGSYAFLAPADFQRLIEGALDPAEPLTAELSEKGFLLAGHDEERWIQQYGDRKHFLNWGPTLHAMVLTERCNHGCQYCHSSIVGMDKTDTDMSIEVATRCVDNALQTTAGGLTIEFQGGEPTANWETLEYIVTYARQRNRLIGKELSFALVTNFSLMTEERLDFLIDNRVQICTSLDGPEDLHNGIRIYAGGNSFELTTRWIRRVNERYKEMGLDPSLYRVEALPTITRASLPRYKEIVDTYVAMGCRAVFLRLLDPFGFAARSMKTLGYSIDEFLDFYTKSLDYIIELNKQGKEVMERLAAIMLSKIIAGYEPNYLDLRSPGGAAIGQLAYHPSGRVYSSDEGRMVAAMGDDSFLLGDVRTDSYGDIVNNAVSRSLILAGTAIAKPGCASCAFEPYCGQQPEYNYKTQGSIFGRMPDSMWCRKHMGIFDVLFERLGRATEEEMAIFRRWTINRAQEHFLQTEEPEVAA